MLSARSLFQKTTLSIPFMQNLIDQIKKMYDDNEALAQKTKNVLRTVLDANQLLESHTPAITDESTPSASTESAEKVDTYQKARDRHQGTNFLGKLMGPAGLFLLNALSADATPAGLVIKSGHAGGVELCKGLVWCIEATINNASTNEVLTQACRKISIAGTGGSQFTEWALSSEFGEKEFLTVLSSALDAAPDWYTNRTTECSPMAGLWTGTQMTGSATHLTEEGCNQFKEFFTNTANAAANWRTSAKVFGLSLAITVAAALLIACCYCMCRCAFDDDFRETFKP